MKASRSFLLYSSWTISLIATLGSLYFSEVKHFVPCMLCWYQRILMYPLVIIVAVGILRNDKKIFWYVLPFTVLGMMISFYHVLLQQGIIAESAAPCTLGVSCTTKYINYLGFISIPLLSFLSFAAVTVSMVVYRKLDV